MQYPKVSIVILNFNTKELLQKLIPFALKTDYPAFEVVVADNASSDGSLSLIQSEFPDVQCISLTTNLGYAGGYNEALKQLDTDFWVLLNSDVEVDSCWLKPMMEILLNDDKIAAVQPKILDFNNRQKFEYAGACGGLIDQFGYPFCIGRIFDEIETDIGQYDSAAPVFWASGAALLVRAKVYTDLGGLDQDFFAHMEEIDLCWRMQNAGFEVWVEPKSVVYHIGGGTLNAQSAKKVFLNFRNNLVLLTKNLPALHAVKILGIRLILDGISGVKFILDGNPKLTWMVVKAHWAFFTRFRFYWSKRKQNDIPRSTSHLHGYFKLSIVYQFFVRGVRQFSDIKKPSV